MKIILRNIGKCYGSEWIFRKINLEFSAGHHYVILGANGSGKSTLLQLIAGNQVSSEGEIDYFNESGKKIEAEHFFTHISFASPYLELVEEFTLPEIIQFHSKFKKFRCGADEITAICSLENAAVRPLKNYSSGMKQRVRLALAILSDTPILLLDEPCSNLDKKSVDWYNHLIDENKSGRTIMVCSNQQKEEYGFCDKEIKMEDYKK